MALDLAQRDRTRTDILLQAVQEGARHFGRDQALQVRVAIFMIIADHLHGPAANPKAGRAQAAQPFAGTSALLLRAPAA